MPVVGQSGLEHFQLHVGDPARDQAQVVGSAMGQVDHTVAMEGAAIVDAHGQLAAVV